MPESLLNVVELAEYVRKKREEEKLSVRQLAEITHISPSTLSRIENGVCTPDSDTLAKLTNWLGIPVDSLMRGELLPQIQAQDKNQVESVSYGSMPDFVEAHLRADPNLKEDTAKALSELFRVAYNQFASSDFSEVKSEATKAKKSEIKKTPYANRSRK